MSDDILDGLSYAIKQLPMMVEKKQDGFWLRRLLYVTEVYEGVRTPPEDEDYEVDDRGYEVEDHYPSLEAALDRVLLYFENEEWYIDERQKDLLAIYQLYKGKAVFAETFERIIAMLGLETGPRTFGVAFDRGGGDEVDIVRPEDWEEDEDEDSDY